MARNPAPSDSYRCYDDLARRFAEGIDFAVHLRRCERSAVAILAPHGGCIEGGTSEVARLIAGDEHGLYLFEGLRTTGDNFACLHLASHCFDEPRCLELIRDCDTVISVHGFAAAAPDVLLGGLDERLKQLLADALTACGFSVLSHGHRFPGRDPRNICNRGRGGEGVQLELSEELRASGDRLGFADAVRSVIDCSASV